MGAIQSRKKYILLYGPMGSGKSMLLYSQKSTIQLYNPVEPTEGLNYEELEDKNRKLGVFEVSGDPKQYDIVNIIASTVHISGIIFTIAYEKIEEIQMAKTQLELVLGNNYLEENEICLLVIYNYKLKHKDRFLWLTQETLNETLKLEEISQKFKLKSYQSLVFNCSSNTTEILDDNSLLKNMSDFMDKMFKEE